MTECHCVTPRGALACTNKEDIFWVVTRGHVNHGLRNLCVRCKEWKEDKGILKLNVMFHRSLRPLTTASSVLPSLFPGGRIETA